MTRFTPMAIHIAKLRRNIVRTILVAGFMACSLVAAQAAMLEKTVQLTAGKASTVELGKQVSDLLVANPAIADVGTLRANRLYIVGKAVGDTNVLAFDGNGNQLADISVHVRVDDQNLSDAMREFFPGEKIDVKTINNNIVLSGSVSTPLVANRVRDLASRFVTQSGQTIVDLMGVQGEQQVMVKVKVMEIRRNVLREFGVETDYKGINAGTNAGFLNTTAGIGLTALQPFATGQILFDDNGKFGPLKLALSALERDGLVNTLAEPNLTSISGETAGFLAGGEFPVPSGVDQNGNITIEFKQFGVSLHFTPTVLSKDNISLHLATEVSNISNEQSVTLQGVTIPGLNVRRAETTVELASGGTIMLAGLIQSGTVNGLNGLPGVTSIPVLGELFKSKSFRRDESELLIMVSPYIVRPYAENNAQEISSATPVLPAQPALMNGLAPAPAPAMPSSVIKSDAQTEAPVNQTAQAAPVAPVTAEPVSSGKAKMIAQAAPKQAITPVSQRYLDNIHSVYGSRAKLLAPQNAAFGYIVD